MITIKYVPSVAHAAKNAQYKKVPIGPISRPVYGTDVSASVTVGGGGMYAIVCATGGCDK